MTEAVFVPSIAMIVSMAGIMVIGVVGGALLYVCEKLASKNRSTH